MSGRKGDRGGHVSAWSITTRRPRRFQTGTLPTELSVALVNGLAREHARDPFSPLDVREAARRVADVAAGLRIDADIVRGGLDLGGAELDHVWVVVADRVVDVALPVNADSFLVSLRAFVAGDMTSEELDRAAHGHGFDRRVVGTFPETCAYLGLPVFTRREPAALGPGS